MASAAPAFTITPGPLATAFDAACARLESRQFAAALWARRLDVWTHDEATQRLIANRLGWLDAVTFVTPLLPRLRAFAEAIRRDGFTDVVLLGMGGSSLAPEVLRQVFTPAPGAPRVQVLDSVDPEAVRAAMTRARDTLFILASKSGTTIEPNAMATEAARRVIAAGHADWASRFVAITDEGTALHARATAERFRDVFVNPGDIGGRYSALSLFGMVPAAVMGLDLQAILAGAAAMEQACRTPAVRENPGLALGALIGAGASSRRDKLTLRLPERLASFGLWVEQLVAESTGKHGKGVIPVTGEPGGALTGADRVIVSFTLSGSEDPEPPAVPNDVPAAHLALPGVEALGAEFLRWEVATATAGLLLEINPFDEPNVQQAKDATRVILGRYKDQRALPYPAPDAAVGHTRLTLSEPARTALNGRPAQAFLSLLQPGDYLGVLAYLPSEQSVWEAPLQALRAAVAARGGWATTLGYGPRYLHSTGQLHKGGAANGVFVVITADADEDLAIPGEPYSFGVLEAAQALGDFESLERTGRRALLLRLPRRDPTVLQAALEALVGG